MFIDNKQNTLITERSSKDIWYKLNEFPLLETKSEIHNITKLTKFKEFISGNSLLITKENQKKDRVKHMCSKSSGKQRPSKWRKHKDAYSKLLGTGPYDMIFVKGRGEFLKK